MELLTYIVKLLNDVLIGKEVDYCFHLNTTQENRRKFVIRKVSLEDDDAGGFALSFIGEDRSIIFFSDSILSYIADYKSFEWIREGELYMFFGEGLRIDGREIR